MRLSLGTIVVLASLGASCVQIKASEPAAALPNRSATAAVQPQGAWWSGSVAGWIGAVGGTTVGLLGGLLGTLASLGKARRFVLALSAGLIGLGIVGLLAGGLAWMLGQPFAVFYPLLLFGLLLTVIYSAIRPTLRRGYEQRELRKMAAMDAGRTN